MAMQRRPVCASETRPDGARSDPSTRQVAGPSGQLSAFNSKRLLFAHSKPGQAQAGSGAKYGNKVHVRYGADGKEIKIHSGREAKRYDQLHLLQRAGKISQLQWQVPYTFTLADQLRALGWLESLPVALQVCAEALACTHPGSNRKVKYVLDFRYVDNETQELVHEDSKGFRTKDYALKQAMMLWVHGIEVLEV